MAAFLIGLVVSAAIALGTGLGLSALDRSTPEAFYTRYTVPLDDRIPADGRLSHHHPPKAPAVDH